MTEEIVQGDSYYFLNVTGACSELLPGLPAMIQLIDLFKQRVRCSIMVAKYCRLSQLAISGFKTKTSDALAMRL